MRRELVCIEPGTPPQLKVRTREVPFPKAGQVLVRVEATSVNPIDIKRAAGYGRCLLSLKGAATFPLVLGNDVAGTVEASGTGVSRFSPGQRVFGLVGTGKHGGAHASHVIVSEEQLAAAPEDADLRALAVLPYSFTTMWLAVRATGLSPANASGARVLINGASGALGRLALQLLHAWGSKVTAICGPGKREDLLALGALHAVERGPASITSLSTDYDVVLNFGCWDDELALASRLGLDALGHATTVHPLLGNFDQLGWLRGGLACWHEWKRVQTAVACRALKARYRWILFKPDREALEALAVGLRGQRFFLPPAVCMPFEDASAAFAHIAAGKTGRAVLLPETASPNRARVINGVATMADILAIERLHPSLPNSTYEMIRAAALTHAKAPALSFFLRVRDHARAETWSYESFFARITATANFFHALGIGKDDVIAFVLPNLPETHLTIWGGEAAGIVYAINPLLEPAVIGEFLRAGEAKVLVTLAPFPGVDLWTKLQPILGEVPSLRHLVLVNLADHAPGVKRWATKFLQRREERKRCGKRGVAAVCPPQVAVHDFADGIRSQPADRLVSGRVIAPDDLSSFFCTGGTTGAPKLAMRSHANEVANAWSAGRFLGDSIDASKTLFCGLPLFHVNAVLVTGLLPFSRGAHVMLGTPAGYRGEGVISRFWELVEQHRINFFSGVPTVYAALLEQPTEGRDIQSLEYGLCGAAPMPIELMSNFQDRTGLKIIEGYGLTEATCVSTCNPPLGERRLGSIGLRLPRQPMKAVVLDDGGAYVRDCADGEAGVLVTRGLNVFAGYKLPEHNQGLWVDAGDGERWLNTGDLGWQDADGYFYLTGRKKELIIRGGHNIDPASIEEPLVKHPAVQIVAAVGRPDVHAGEVAVAYVQLKPGAGATEVDLMSFAREHIGERAAMPKAIRIIPAMPLTGVGKIYKVELKHREIQDALSEALRDTGVPARSVIVCNDPKYGTTVQVSLTEGADPQLAREVLGHFPFRFRLAEPALGLRE